jgi:hypothetical protein
MLSALHGLRPRTRDVWLQSQTSPVIIRELLVFVEERNTEATLLRRELCEKDALLDALKIRKKGKRVAIRGQVILSKA